ncbi:hypothetical protein CK203_096504 [Vitis vinifera]|uniref:DUF659 domain-containing protein n=1 Tax=Vitis vinifera TaxID=29760 RepID=A0A438CTW7_VITVI|nr:hypothetical protein CK203_096504 [Vitis vinifera]
MNMGSEDVNEDLFGLDDEDFGEEINSRMNVTSNQGESGVTYPSFQSMIEAIGQYGVGMKRPTLHEGTMFMQSIDASSIIKMGEKMFELLNKWVEKVGEENVIQVIIDNHSSYVMAGYLYKAMNRAKDTLMRSFNGNKEKYKEIFKIIDKRLTRDPVKQEKVVAEVSLCVNAQGLFGNELAVRTRNTRASVHRVVNGIGASLKIAEESRFDTRARARAKANSSIIPPTRGIASSSRTLPSHLLIDEDEDEDMADSTNQEDEKGYKCDDGNDDDDDFVDLKEE